MIDRKLIPAVLVAGVAALAAAGLVGHAALAEDPPAETYVYLEAEGLLPALESFASNPAGTEEQAIARRQNNCCGVNWSSRAQALFENFTPGARMTLRFEVPDSAVYGITAVFSRAPDFGIFDLSIDGRRVGERQDGYAPAVQRSEPTSFGSVPLAAGSHTLTVTVVDKNPAATRYFAGLDYVELRGTPASPPPAPRAEEAPRPPAAAATPAAGAEPSRASCVPADGFRSTQTTPRGRRVGLAFTRAQPRPVDVDVFQQAVGRRVVGERLVARWANRTSGLTWNGRANRRGRRVSDGYYVVRYRMRLAGGGTDVRRTTLRRAGGRFTVRPPFYRRAACGLVRSHKLTRPVFGGRTNREVYASYQLGRPGSVAVEVWRGSRLVRRERAVERPAGQTFRVRLDAEGLGRADHQVRLIVRSGDQTETSVVTARRL